MPRSPSPWSYSTPEEQARLREMAQMAMPPPPPQDYQTDSAAVPEPDLPQMGPYADVLARATQHLASKAAPQQAATGSGIAKALGVPGFGRPFMGGSGQAPAPAPSRGLWDRIGDVGGGLSDAFNPVDRLTDLRDRDFGDALLAQPRGVLGALQSAAQLPKRYGGEQVTGGVLGALTDDSGHFSLTPRGVLDATINANPVSRVASDLIRGDTPYSRDGWDRFKDSDAPTGVKTAAEFGSDPLSWIGPGALGKLGGIGKFIEQPMGASALGAAGAGAAAQGAEMMDLPDWAQAAAPLVGGIAGGIVGANPRLLGQGARTAGDVLNEGALAGERGSFDPTQIGKKPGGGLTAEAEDLLRKVDAGGVPGSMTGNLERIAREHGIPVTGSTTPNEVIDALRAKASGGPLNGFASAIEEPIPGGAGAASPAPPATGSPLIDAADGGGVPPISPVTATPSPSGGSPEEMILGLPKPTPTPLSRTGIIMNRLKETLGVAGDNPIAKTAVDYRKQTLPIVESQANNLSTQVDYTVRSAFRVGADGRVDDIAGRPFIQDIAARLPEYRPLLSPSQVAAMEQVQAQLAPFKAVLDRAGIAPSSRTDIVDGGFYMPRGRADLEGADAAVKVGSGRGGGKAGFEKHAKFDSMAQGADAGYEYAPLAEAVNSYAKDAGARAVDTHVADYFKQAKNEAGKLIGETPSDRMDQVIKGQWEDVNQRLLSVRERLATAEKRAGLTTGKGDELATVLEKQSTGASIPLDASAAVERDINRFITRAQQRITALRQKGAGFAESADNLERDLAAIKGERTSLAPEYKAALEEARATPREQSTIALPRSAALNGWTFPDEVASAMQAALNKEKPLMGRGATPIKAMQAYNTIVRGLRATGDVSFTGIQGLIGASRDPVGYGKAMAAAFKSMADPQALGAYLKDFDAKAIAAGKPTIAERARHGLHIGGADTEYSIKTGINKSIDAISTGSIPGTKSVKLFGKGTGGLNPFRGANRSFGYFGDVMRVELSDIALESAARHGYDLADPVNLRSAMDVANNATGWSRNTFAGDLGQLGMFAPRFFQSQLEYLATAAQTGTIGGMEARRGLARLAGLSVGLTVLANEATDRPIDYKEMFDVNSPNFMHFRVKGQDFTLLGPWDSLLKAAVKLSPLELDRDIATTDALKMPDPAYLARTKASPAIGMAWDLLSGKTFTGQDARDPGSIATQLVVPFSLQDVTNQSPIQTLTGATGLKSSAMSPTENLDVLARARFGGDFYDIEPSQQEVIKAEHPDTWQRAVEAGNSQRREAIAKKDELLQQQLASEQGLRDGTLSPRDWKTQMDSRRDQLRGAESIIYKDKNVPVPADPAQYEGFIKAGKTARDRYFRAIDTNARPDGTVDWDKVDAWQSAQSQADQDYIARNTKLGGTPLQKLRSKLADEWYSLPTYRGVSADDTVQMGKLSDAIGNTANLPKNAPAHVRLLALARVVKANPDKYSRTAIRAEQLRILGKLQLDPRRERYKLRTPEIALLTGQAGLNSIQLRAIEQRLGRME